VFVQEECNLKELNGIVSFDIVERNNENYRAEAEVGCRSHLIQSVRTAFTDSSANESENVLGFKIIIARRSQEYFQ
jgi:hypothetical protein